VAWRVNVTVFEIWISNFENNFVDGGTQANTCDNIRIFDAVRDFLGMTVGESHLGGDHLINSF